MDLESTTRFVAAGAAGVRRQFKRVAGVALVVLAVGVLAPLVPILVGTLAVIAVALYGWVPDSRTWLQPVVRVPVAGRGTRHAWLAAYGIGGAFLVVVGSVGATTRSHVKSEWQAERRRLEVAEADASRMLQRAHDELEVGSVGQAELTLMAARELQDAPHALRQEIESLYERVHRSGDAEHVLEVLVGLPPQEFQAFATSHTVPESLDFPERVLTLRAVGIGIDRLEQARQLRERLRAPRTAESKPAGEPQG